MSASRWVLTIVAVAALIALVSFARGEPRHGEPAPPAAVTLFVTG